MNILCLKTNVGKWKLCITHALYQARGDDTILHLVQSQGFEPYSALRPIHPIQRQCTKKNKVMPVEGSVDDGSEFRAPFFSFFWVKEIHYGPRTSRLPSLAFTPAFNTAINSVWYVCLHAQRKRKSVKQRKKKTQRHKAQRLKITHRFLKA